VALAEVEVQRLLLLVGQESLDKVLQAAQVIQGAQAAEVAVRVAQDLEQPLAQE
jgi:hypothetical protein